MAPEYTSYEGYSQRAKQMQNYSQAVRIGDTVEISGQGNFRCLIQRVSANCAPGGWNRHTDTTVIDRDINRQYEQAFENVEHTLKTAGSKGWEDVSSIRSYYALMNDEAMEVMVRCLKKACPNHQPIWTAIGVPKLGLDDMKIEIEVGEYSPK
jgi:enamine deaminase RidA (YjgF/YER057c/UK114 family)